MSSGRLVPYRSRMERVLLERLRRVPLPVGDAALAVAVVIVNVVAIRVATEPGSRPLNPLAYALAVSYGVLLLARRRWPLGAADHRVLHVRGYSRRRRPGGDADGGGVRQLPAADVAAGDPAAARRGGAQPPGVAG